METDMLHIWKAKLCMRLRHKRAEEYVGERVSEGLSGAGSMGMATC